MCILHISPPGGMFFTADVVLLQEGLFSMKDVHPRGVPPGMKNIES
jgi:hypothetical protein